MNSLFPRDHGAATHSCIMHDTERGTLCKNATRTTAVPDVSSPVITSAPIEFIPAAEAHSWRRQTRQICFLDEVYLSVWQHPCSDVRIY